MNVHCDHCGTDDRVRAVSLTTHNPDGTAQIRNWRVCAEFDAVLTAMLGPPDVEVFHTAEQVVSTVQHIRDNSLILE